MRRAIFGALAAAVAVLSAAHGGKNPPVAAAATADDLVVVDCLLPGQVVRLGTEMSYVSRRRPARLTALECRVRGGEYVAWDRADLRTALGVWQQAAQDGDPEAALRLGEIYERGLGVPPDFESAALWYRRAAEKGLSAAMVNLGQLYERGRGVGRDPAEALRWYRRASGLPELALALDGGEREEFDRTRRRLAEAEARARDAEQRLSRAQSEAGVSAAARDALASEAARLRDAVDALRREAEAAGAELGHARRDAAAARAEVERLSATLSTVREDAERAREAERRLGEARAEADRRERRVRELEAQLAARTPPADVPLPPPSIELIEPQLARTRGVTVVATDAASRTLVGRVDAPAGLFSFAVNDGKVDVDARGMFRAAVTVAGERTPVRLVAVDARGRRTAVEFDLVAPSAPKRDAPRAPSDTPLQTGAYYALLIANEGYTNLPRLETPAGDARALGALLESRYGFKVTLLFDADRYRILSALEALRARLTEKDSLLVFYAGHGEFDGRIQRGYWLPVDAERANTANWIATTTISDTLALLPARHVLVVSDSCFSGALTRSALPALESGGTPEERALWLRAVFARRSRTALTSGGLQPVLDAGGGGHSVFARALLAVLSAAGEPFEARRLHMQVAARVLWDASNLGSRQEPEYAPVPFAGHEAGDFVFVPRS